MNSIVFFASGSPSTKGSSRAFIRGGRAIITNDAGEKAKSWAAIVGWAAREAMKGAAPFPGAVRVSTAFYLARPKSHYRSNGQLKPNAPAHAATKPDGDKLTRCTWDALTGIAFVDDSRIVAWSGEKPYSNDGRTGAQITIESITDARSAVGIVGLP